MDSLGVDAHAHIFRPDFPLSPARSYTPGVALLGDYLAAASRWGTGRVVLVQPSPYGTDNSALLDSLRVLGKDRARGIAVISPMATDMELDDMADSGVVGVRLNRQADPKGGYEPLGKSLEQTLEKVHERGWVVQLYSDPESLAGCEKVLAASPAPIVLDHYAGLKIDASGESPHANLVLNLIENPSIWVKLSGPYRARLGGVGQHALQPLTRKLVEAIPNRLVWGSDWPFTGGGTDRSARKVSDIEPFRDFDAADYLDQLISCIGTPEQMEKILVHNPASLYGF